MKRDLVWPNRFKRDERLHIQCAHGRREGEVRPVANLAARVVLPVSVAVRRHLREKQQEQHRQGACQYPGRAPHRFRLETHFASALPRDHSTLPPSHGLQSGSPQVTASIHDNIRPPGSRHTTSGPRSGWSPAASSTGPQSPGRSFARPPRPAPYPHQTSPSARTHSS